jgi:hypothetical protein
MMGVQAKKEWNVTGAVCQRTKNVAEEKVSELNRIEPRKKKSPKSNLEPSSA